MIVRRYLSEHVVRRMGFPLSIRPFRVEELAEICAIRFDKEGFPTFNTDWQKK